MINIALVGLGHFGKNHLKCIQEIGVYNLVGVYDINQTVANQVAEAYNVKVFSNIDELINASDVVDIVTPTTTHFELSTLVIDSGKHVFIEKPFTNNLTEAKLLSSKLAGTALKLQIGHIERFNPAFLAIENLGLKPDFIEVNRFAKYNERGLDVSVVMDLMIHDLDIVLKLVPYKIISIEVSELKNNSKLNDAVSVKLLFENGTIALISSNRDANENVREYHIVEKNTYYNLDFLSKKASKSLIINEDIDYSLQINNLKSNATEIESSSLTNNSLKSSLESFANCISNNKEPKVNLTDGINAIELASLIIDKIEKLILQRVPVC